jgi:hypothetical protein
MGVLDQLARILYHLYRVDPKMRRYFTDLYCDEAKKEYEGEVKKHFAQYKTSLQDAVEVALRHRDKLHTRTKDVFFVVEPKYPVELKRRFYLNCMPDKIGVVVAYLINFMLSNPGIEFFFKFPRPEVLTLGRLTRADKIVVYFSNNPQTVQQLTSFVRSGQVIKFLHPNAPLFTKRIEEGIGFAYEPSPEHQKFAHEHTKELESFGSFMCLVIAKALHEWSLKHGMPKNRTEVRALAEQIYRREIIGRHKMHFEP